jgi:hypothetical protein
LEDLRKIGTNEGLYRYAEENEDSDLLSSKLTSIFELVSLYSTIPIEILDFSPNIKFNDIDLKKKINFPLNAKGYGI